MSQSFSMSLPVVERPLAWLRARFRQLVRYAGVSAVSTSTSLITLALGITVLGLGPVWANLLATAVGTAPSFELNRRWVWRCADRRSLARQIIPFTALSFAGLGLSTLTVHLAATATTHWSTSTRTLAIELASVVAYGSLWVVQFVLLDRLLFRRRPEVLHAGGTRLGGPTAATACTGTGDRPAVPVSPDGTDDADGSHEPNGLHEADGLHEPDGPHQAPHASARGDSRVHASVFDAA